MTATQWSYLAMWCALAAVLMVSGGPGVGLAPLAVLCGLHRSQAVSAVRRGGMRWPEARETRPAQHSDCVEGSSP